MLVFSFSCLLHGIRRYCVVYEYAKYTWRLTFPFTPAQNFSMGKKSRKQAAAAAEKPRLGKSLIDKATCRLVDELCESKSA